MTNETTLMEESTDVAANAVAPIIGGGELLGMGVSMAIVLVVILVLGWLYSRSRLAGSGASDIINIVASRALGPKERLFIVEVAEQQLLIGMTSTAVQTLHVFDEPVSVEKESLPQAGFAARLRSALRDVRS